MACKAMRATAVAILVLSLGLLILHGGLASRPAFAQDAFDDPFAEGGDKPAEAGGGDAGGGDAGGDKPAEGEGGGDAAAAPTPEPETHEDEKMKPYDAREDSKDPFEPKIEPPMPVVAPTSSTPVVQQKKEIPPLPISVSFIVGSESNRMALLELNGKPYEMRAGEAEEGGLFKVLEITEKEVTIYDSRVQKNRVIKLSDM